MQPVHTWNRVREVGHNMRPSKASNSSRAHSARSFVAAHSFISFVVALFMSGLSCIAVESGSKRLQAKLQPLAIA